MIQFLLGASIGVFGYKKYQEKMKNDPEFKETVEEVMDFLKKIPENTKNFISDLDIDNEKVSAEKKNLFLKLNSKSTKLISYYATLQAKERIDEKLLSLLKEYEDELKSLKKKEKKEDIKIKKLYQSFTLYVKLELFYSKL